MRLFLALFIVFFFTACNKQALKSVKVVRLYDGDSFVVEENPCLPDACAKFEVRMLGMDAPEGKQKPWGDRSRAKLKSLINKNQIVYLEYDLDKTDKYNRHLAYVFADENKETFLNLQMIKSGYAELYAFAKDLKYLRSFKEAEAHAKKQGLAIWDKENGLKLSPYKFRKKNVR